MKNDYQDGYYFLMSHSGDRHIVYIESDLVYFCGESESESVHELLADSWQLMHNDPIPIDGELSFEGVDYDPINY